MNLITSDLINSDLIKSEKRGSSEARELLLGQLKSNIAQIEKLGRVDDGQVVSSGCRVLDEVLPENGYRRGAIVEWMAGSDFTTSRSRNSSGGLGADYLALLAAKHACADGGALVIADLHRQFYPPAAAAMGLDLGNVIVLQPERNELSRGESALSLSKERLDGFFWSIDQALRCSAVAAVWSTLDQVHERWFRRFQLSAESSGALGLFVRPAVRMGQPSWAEVQWHVTGRTKIGTQGRAKAKRETSAGNSSPLLRTAQSMLQDSLRDPATTSRSVSALQRIELELMRCRGARTGQKIKLDIDTITGSVCGSRERSDHEYDQRQQSIRSTSQEMPLSVASQLAHSAVGSSKARA